MRHENYRILMVGDNKTVLDMFFYHMDYYEVQTSSVRADDVQSHLKYFKPQAFVYTIVSGDYNGIKKAGSVKSYLMKAAEIPFVFIGTTEDCAQVERIIPGVVDAFIEKPFTVASIQDKIDDLIEMREERLAEERRQAEEARAELEAKKAALEKEKAELEKEEEEAKKSGGTGKEILSADMDLDIDTLLENVKKEDRRKHVLVIDDDSGMLKVIKEHLKEDYDVATAISGKLARKFLEKKSTDLILLDYMMPGEDGPAVLKSFRENPRTKNLPVVFLTGMTDREKIIELLRSEDRPQGYIVKPVEKDKLIGEIRGLIG
ncbi:MAG: response regulator [Lachnospiraceae bacterium]|nr:response regulator [Lachnospiraceae bacterium]